MNSLIRFLAQAIARPLERLFRSREHLGQGRGLKINNLNYALVPFVIAILLCALAAFMTASLMRKPQEQSKSLPWLGALVVFAGVSFWLGTKRVLWVRIDNAVWVVRLFSANHYPAARVKRWGFLWGRTDVRHDPPPSEATFLIEFNDDTEFERVVSPEFAARVAAEMKRLS